MAKRAGYQVIGLPNYIVWVCSSAFLPCVFCKLYRVIFCVQNLVLMRVSLAYRYRREARKRCIEKINFATKKRSTKPLATKRNDQPQNGLVNNPYSLLWPFGVLLLFKSREARKLLVLERNCPQGFTAPVGRREIGGFAGMGWREVRMIWELPTQRRICSSTKKINQITTRSSFLVQSSQRSSTHPCSLVGSSFIKHTDTKGQTHRCCPRCCP